MIDERPIENGGVMGKLEYREIMWAEMKPDVYGGDNCDEHIPQWWCYAEGDKGDGTDADPIALAPEHFPPGTKVVISVPCCPKCHQEPELCQTDEYCDFDWHNWTEEQYS